MNKLVANNASPAVLLGINDGKLVEVPRFKSVLHPEVVEPLEQMAFSATKAGFNLQVASSYRSFARQLFIWNNKANGLRPVLDANGMPIDISLLSDEEKIWAILRWSALPGASRHHWGTDIDVYDTSRMAADYVVQLTLEETQQGGPFADFHDWLTNELQKSTCNFFRPYVNHIGGIAPEPWHLSYAPIANGYAAQMSESIVRAQLQNTDIALKETLLNNLSEIYQHFVKPYC